MFKVNGHLRHISTNDEDANFLFQIFKYNKKKKNDILRLWKKFIFNIFQKGKFPLPPRPIY